MDIISNRLTSIRNGQQAGLVMVKIPFSSTNVNIEKNKLFSILNILRDEGYIRGFSYKIGNSLYNKQCIMIYLKYDSQGNGIIKAITRISTPGRRVYINTASL